MTIYKTISLILNLLLCLTAEATHPILNNPTLKVLDIGNSYTVDATAMLPQITEASGSDISTMCLYRAVRGGASLKSWCDIYNDCDSLTGYTIEKVMGTLPSDVRTGKGNASDGSLFREALNTEKWDIVIIHQVSTLAPYYDEWNDATGDGSLGNLLSIVKEHQPDAVIGFYIVHSTWDNYSRNAEKSSIKRWKLISQSVERLCADYGIDFIIPYGTAVENLRASTLNNRYDLTRDGLHCGFGLCRYAAACCYYETLIAPRSGISVLGNTARYDASANKSGKFPPVSVTDANALTAQKAAILACEYPFLCINPDFILNPEF